MADRKKSGDVSPHSKALSGRRILPKPITGRESVPDLIDRTFLAYNAARLHEACRLFTEKMLARDVTVALSLSGAMTPAGIGASAIIPLIKAGFVDWIISTGANLYHDLHHAANLPLYKASPFADDPELRRRGVVRIYDILLNFDVLMRTDALVRKILSQPEFQKEMGTTQLHWLMGKYAAELEKQTGTKDGSVLAAAYRADVPIFCSSPGDSGIGMNLAAMELRGGKLRINPSIDVTESAAIVLGAQQARGRTAAVIIGGGSPKNFLLQTEPQIQEVLGIKEFGHEFFLQITDARPDTGGLSGATPHEAVSWGKVQPDKLPGAVVCYLDSTVALPLITHYALARHKPRKLRRLYRRLPAFVASLTKQYLAAGR